MVDKLRNIALVGHGDSGKTSLAEAMLYKTGATKRLGRVEDGNTAMDYEPEELKRGITISSAFHQADWKKHTINLIDTPGDQNFFSDTRTSMQAADGVVFLIDAIDGVKVQTEQGWGFADEFNQPCLIFVNKLDRERADFDRTLQDAAEVLDPKPMMTQFPIGAEADFKGVVDLLSMKAYTYDADGKVTVGDIPDDLKEKAETEREVLIENVAEADDELLERYLEGEEISEDEFRAALRKGTLNRAFAPVLCGAATSTIGVEPLMEFIVGCMPSPADRGPRVGVDPATDEETERAPSPEAPFSAFVFKTVADPYAGQLSIFRVVSGTLGGDGNLYNVNKESKERYSALLRLAGKEQKPVKEAGPGDIVAVAKLKETRTGDTLCEAGAKIRYACAESLPPVISYAVSAREKGEEDKVFQSLAKIMEEDPALKLTRNAETKQILLSGMGQVHIEAVCEKARRKFGVEVELKIPKVPFKETIKKKVRVQGKHKKQTGGHGQYGDCWIVLEPMERGEGFQFVDAIVGGVIPKGYIPAVEKGVVEASEKGILAGYPVVDFKVTVDDGSYHSVDSSEMAFKVAGSLAFKKAVEQANPVLLEPIMKITVTTPDDFTGDIMGDLNGRRGRVLGMDSKGKNQIITANVPMSEFLTYAPDLRSMTGGRGMFTLEYSHYDELPAQMAEKVIEAAKKEKE